MRIQLIVCGNHEQFRRHLATHEIPRMRARFVRGPEQIRGFSAHMSELIVSCGAIDNTWYEAIIKTAAERGLSIKHQLCHQREH